MATKTATRIQEGDQVTFAVPENEVEKAFVGTVLLAAYDATPARITVRWDNSGRAIEPVFTCSPETWMPKEN